MQRKTSQDFDQELLILFDAYVHGAIDRRGFLERAQKFAVGGLTAAALLASLSPNFALGQVLAKDDQRIETSTLEFASPAGSGMVRGYLARPAKTPGKLPGIVVVHENRGLNPHIEDITRRLALAGFMAFAPDALTPLGGYPGDEDKARELFAKLDQTKTAKTLLQRPTCLKADKTALEKLGLSGFVMAAALSTSFLYACQACRRPCLFMATCRPWPMQRLSKPPCCCILLIRMSVSTRPGHPMKSHSGLRACSLRPTNTPVPNTASTTTPPRVLTQTPPSLLGSEPWPFLSTL
jgi:hypothetical protein